MRGVIPNYTKQEFFFKSYVKDYRIRSSLSCKRHMKKITFRVNFFRMNIENDISHLFTMKRLPHISHMQYILAEFFL